MMSNIILAAVLIWAFGYVVYKSVKAYRQANSNNVQCMCSGCSGGCSTGKKI